MRDHSAWLFPAAPRTTTGSTTGRSFRRVYGLSNQRAEYQRDLADALRLPYPLLTDEAVRLSDDPGLPTFSAGGLTLFSRQSLLLRDGAIEHVFYPVFPPDQHARVVLDYLATH